MGGILDTLETFSQSVMMGTRHEVPNPNYPEEDFEKFIIRMIEKKKKKIEILLDVSNL
jgi:hypothetical protein